MILSIFVFHLQAWNFLSSCYGWQHLMNLVIQKRLFILSSIARDSCESFSSLISSSSSLPSTTEIFCVSSHILFWFKMALMQSSRVFYRQSIWCSLIIELDVGISASELTHSAGEMLELNSRTRASNSPNYSFSASIKSSFLTICNECNDFKGCHSWLWELLRNTSALFLKIDLFFFFFVNKHVSHVVHLLTKMLVLSSCIPEEQKISTFKAIT